jgi:hypothetical protein
VVNLLDKSLDLAEKMEARVFALRDGAVFQQTDNVEYFDRFVQNRGRLVFDSVSRVVVHAVFSLFVCCYLNISLYDGAMEYVGRFSFIRVLAYYCSVLRLSCTFCTRISSSGCDASTHRQQTPRISPMVAAIDRRLTFPFY